MAGGSSSVQNGLTPSNYVPSSNVIIRYYRHPDDLSSIRQMFVSSMIDTPKSPYNIGIERSALPTKIVTSTLALSVVAFILLSLKSPRGTSLYPYYTNMDTLQWIAISVSIVSALACIYFWNDRRTIRNMFRAYIKEAMEADFNDVVDSFGLHSNQGDIGCVPKGPSGFWVAEDENHNIMGFVGLNSTVKKQRGVGDVRRLIVSPNYRRRGVGEKLMVEVLKHAYAHGMVALEVTTAGWNAPAIKMYERHGWTLKEKYKKLGASLVDLRKDL